jgi:predicted ArsR family transcriptional regulator
MSDSERGNEALIAELLAGRSLREVAEATGVSYSTARRHADDPVFRERLEAASRELVELNPPRTGRPRPETRARPARRRSSA